MGHLETRAAGQIDEIRSKERDDEVGSDEARMFNAVFCWNSFRYPDDFCYWERIYLKIER